MFGGIGNKEIIIFLVIALLIFGPAALPKLARSLGKSLRELKNSLSGVGDEFNDALNDDPEEKSKEQIEKKDTPAQTQPRESTMTANEQAEENNDKEDKQA